MANDKRPLNSTSRDNSSNENQAHEKLPAPEQLTVASQPKKERHSKAFSFVSILFLLALLVAGVMTYLWYEADQDLRVVQNAADTSSSERGGSDDNVSSTDDLLAPATDEDQITTEASSFICATGVLSCEDLTVKTTKLLNDQKNEPAYAKAEATDASGSKTDFYLKRIDAGQAWTIVYEGVTEPSDEIVKKYGLSETLFVADEE